MFRTVQTWTIVSDSSGQPCVVLQENHRIIKVGRICCLGCFTAKHWTVGVTCDHGRLTDWHSIAVRILHRTAEPDNSSFYSTHFTTCQKPSFCFLSPRSTVPQFLFVSFSLIQATSPPPLLVSSPISPHTVSSSLSHPTSSTSVPVSLLTSCSPVSCCSSDCSPLSSGPGWQLSPGDSVSGSERSPSIFPEHIPPLSSSEPPKHLVQQPSSGLMALHHRTDQLVPDTSFKDGGPQPSDTDFEVLSQAISQLRAERQAQRLQQQLECQERLLSNSLHRGSGHATPPPGQGGLIESVQPTPGRKAVADTHSTLQPGKERRQDRGEPPPEGQRRQDRGEPPPEGQRRQDRGEPPPEGQRRGRALGGGGLLGVKSDPRISDASSSSSNNNAAAVTGPNGQTDPTSAEREQTDPRGEPAFSKAAKHGAATSSTFSCPVEGDRSRFVHLITTHLVVYTNMVQTSVGAIKYDNFVEPLYFRC